MLQASIGIVDLFKTYCDMLVSSMEVASSDSNVHTDDVTLGVQSGGRSKLQMVAGAKSDEQQLALVAAASILSEELLANALENAINSRSAIEADGKHREDSMHAEVDAKENRIWLRTLRSLFQQESERVRERDCAHQIHARMGLGLESKAIFGMGPVWPSYKECICELQVVNQGRSPLHVGIALPHIHSGKSAPLAIKPGTYCNVAEMAASTVGASVDSIRIADVPSPPFQNLYGMLRSTLERASRLLPGGERDARRFAGKFIEAFLCAIAAHEELWSTLRKRKVIIARSGI